jgi:PAS domain S-box-containing protein
MADDPLEEELLPSTAEQDATDMLAARRRAEGELRDTQDRLETTTRELNCSIALMRATLDATTEGILVTDAEGRVTGYNQRFLEVWHITPEQIERLERHLDLVPDVEQQLADPGLFKKRLQEIYASTPPETYDLLELRDGRVIERFSRTQELDQKNVGRVWSFRDITDRRNTEEELRQQREWFQVTLSSIGDAVITTDTHLLVTFLNPIAESMTGWKLDEARGKPLEEVFRIVDERNGQPVASPVARALAENAVVGLANHTALVSRGGKRIAIEDSAAPIRDNQGRVTGAVMVFHDVTERRRAEEALRQSEERFRASFNQAAVGMAIADLKGRFGEVNQRFLDILGYTREELGKLTFRELTHPDDLPPTVAEVERLLRGEKSSYSLEKRYIRGDGTPVWSFTTVTLLRNAAGEPERFMGIIEDITARKTGEEALIRLAAVVESSDDAIISKSLEGIINSWNKGAERIFGYTAREILGKPVTTLIPAELVEEEPRILGKLRSGERIDHYETMRLRKDGKLIHVSITVSPIKDSNGTIIGASKIARDITERVRAEESLRESEARFRQLADAMPQIVWTATAEGEFDYFNLRWHDSLHGDGRDRVADWKSALHPDDAGGFFKAWRKSIESGDAFQSEYRFKSRDGSYRWHLGRALPVRDSRGAVGRWYGTSTDIHEQRLVTEALREEYAVTEQLRQVATALATELDLSRVVQIITDAGTKISRAKFGAFFYNVLDDSGGSYMLYTLSGVNREHFEKFPMPRATELFGPAFRDGGVIRIDDVTEDTRLGKSSPFSGVPDGHLPVRSYLAVPVFSRSGDVLGGLFFGHDSAGVFTEKDEKAVLAIAAQASAAMDMARTYQSEQHARSAAEQANKAKDHFIAALSHELRTPLTPALAILSDICHGDTVPDELREDLETVRRNVELEARLIDDLLDLTRITRGKLELHCALVPINRMIEDAVNTCMVDFEAKRITLRRDLMMPPPIVYADSARITQIFWNLLKNAVKFTGEGGSVVIRSRIIERDGARAVCIDVQDTGIGIEPDHLSRVFDAFEQGDRSITRQFGGLGLGLAISQAIAESHSGTLAAASEGAGRGSTFTLMLPVYAGPHVDPLPEDALGNKSRSGRTASGGGKKGMLNILLVEDHEDTAAILSRLLGRMGHHVRRAGSTADALRIAAEAQPAVDLVMSDLGLPDGSGLDLMRELSSRYQLKGIALSGFGMESDIRQSSEAGFSHHLVKPVDINALRAALEDVRKELD